MWVIKSIQMNRNLIMNVLVIDKKLKELPAGCRVGDNANAFLGGFRVWQEAGARTHSLRAKPRLHNRKRTQVGRRKETKRAQV